MLKSPTEEVDLRIKVVFSLVVFVCLLLFLLTEQSYLLYLKLWLLLFNH